jgi:NAD-dependent dihydropyrimidine dehydrogenase PreA subunit
MNEVAERNIVEFAAREIVDGSLSINQDLCFGCGLCVSTCPTDAIRLVDKC